MCNVRFFKLTRAYDNDEVLTPKFEMRNDELQKLENNSHQLN